MYSSPYLARLHTLYSLVHCFLKVVYFGTLNGGTRVFAVFDKDRKQMA